MKKGLILINTGDGKGKTTAAFGMILRAVGHSLKSEVVQFIKQRPTGEITALLKLAPDLVKITQFGNGFTWESTNLEQDKQSAIAGWNHVKQIIESNSCSILLLDEITYPINDNWIDVDDVVKTLQSKHSTQHIILTGRNAPQKLIELADCVTEITPIKHHYNKSIQMQKAIEF